MAETSDGAAPAVLTLKGEDAGQAFGRQLAGIAQPGDVIALWGDLGMGKTVIARGFVQAYCQTDDEVPSPTFTLVQPYEGSRGIVHHFDLYRLKDPEEAFELGIEDAFADGVSLIEWPERLGPYLPADCLNVRLSTGGGADERTAVVSGAGWDERLKEAGVHG